ncbi:dihydrolipoamide acetyltransferase family protein [Leucobacter chromiiresistens]|uniref:Dihydrolipoamide acetyltransferase component of pyruvate dehydrogenase complex n=2 Tax=Leucobacter chromiiresistens TaxID=1079994 RepID=A0A1H0Y7E3_9MICO|nr:dihydrolipoamide acetyltransferase family protein [Leucobacter chromiiresistens]SDQ11020.1 pyruvate dehydrogenase E2 component (dihydrolipoamide acetyltransferase) [Leucobacter chromiiresistens]
MSEMTFPLPDVGEGLTEAEIVAWHVAPGDAVALNQVICEIETAKSLVELPSPFTGVVSELLVEVGATVPVGEPILRVSVEGAGAESAPGGGQTSAEPGAGADAANGPHDTDETRDVVADTTASVAHENGDGGAVLVGYGTGGAVKSRRRRGGEPVLRREAGGADAGRGAPAGAAGAGAHHGSHAVIPVAESAPVIAKPPIRKLAKDLGVDLTQVTGTGIAGEVLRDDVVREASQASVFRNLSTPEVAEAREERIPLKGIRKMTAQAMVTSAFEAPHVSVFTDVDATRTMEFVKRLKSSTDFAGVKVSPLLIFAKAMLWAVRRSPEVNATFTDTEIIRHNFVNLGIAAATPRGLVVPNIKDAQDLSLLDLARAIEQLTITARDGRTSPSDMARGTITITNIGVFGMDFGTPILNPGECGIMAMGTIRQKPWVVDGEVRPRMVTTVGGSFDHRIVDGDVISRFVADVASVLEEPALLLD